ncbi:MAG: sulfur carrier protein ThiS [Verrucomicrobia bacterium]|nr:sulfur carrier protein ThiS [Verrucomicrobiota bacterium]
MGLFWARFDFMNPPMPEIIANGIATAAALPCTIEEFLVAQGLPPRSVVVEHNGAAVAPSEFARRPLAAGDRLEIVKIVAGG